MKLLRTILGIGKIMSSTITAGIGDIDNFDSYKQFAAYCGPVLYFKQANESTYLGHITKRGPQELRTALVRVVVGLLRLQSMYPILRIYSKYSSLKSDKGSGKAIVACARKMSRVVYCVLKDRKPLYFIGRIYEKTVVCINLFIIVSCEGDIKKNSYIVGRWIHGNEEINNCHE